MFHAKLSTKLIFTENIMHSLKLSLAFKSLKELHHGVESRIWDKRCLRNVSYDNSEKFPVCLCCRVVLRVTCMQRGKNGLLAEEFS